MLCRGAHASRGGSGPGARTARRGVARECLETLFRVAVAQDRRGVLAPQDVGLPGQVTGLISTQFAHSVPSPLLPARAQAGPCLTLRGGFVRLGLPPEHLVRLCEPERRFCLVLVVPDSLLPRAPQRSQRCSAPQWQRKALWRAGGGEGRR